MYRIIPFVFCILAALAPVTVYAQDDPDHHLYLPQVGASSGDSFRFVPADVVVLLYPVRKERLWTITNENNSRSG